MVKDYIYLDEDLLNSLTAQIDKGLATAYSSQMGSGEEDTVAKTESISKGIDGFMQVGAKYLKDVSEYNEQKITKSQSEVIENVLHDYAVDLLIEKMNLSEVDLNVKTNEYNEGEFILIEEDFKLYDFDLINKTTNEDTFGLFKTVDTESEEIKKLNADLKFLEKKKNKSKEEKDRIKQIKDYMKLKKEETTNNFDTFKTLNALSKFCMTIFPETILIKTKKSLTYAKEENFRMSSSQLSLLNDSKRKIKIFGQIVAIKTETHPEGNFKELKASQINQITSSITDIFLSNFEMLNDGDYEIKPVAIFF